MMGYRRDIDGLRGLAITLVVLFHAFPESFAGGFFGVDVFFVISGYLISSLLFKDLHENSFSFKTFLTRRANRLFPTLILILLTILGVAYWEFFPAEYASIGKNVAASSIFSSNFLQYSESGYFDTSSKLKPLLHLWSLAVEEQFYLIWPFTLALLWKKKKTLGLGLALMCLLSLAGWLIVSQSNPSMAFYLPVFRFWELIAGGLLALPSFKQTLNKNQNSTLSAIGISLIVISATLPAAGVILSPWFSLLPVIGALLIISAGEKSWLNNHFLGNKSIVGLGLISYPLYLWHCPVLSYLFITREEISSQDRFLAIAISLILALFTYLFLERPLKPVRRSPRFALAMSACLLFIGFSALSIHVSEGEGARVPSALAKILSIPDLRKHFQFEHRVRDGICYNYDMETTPADLLSACVEKQRPLAMLWGDSYAAALYPGLLRLQKEKQSFGIGQITMHSSPPLVGLQIENDNPANLDLALVNAKALKVVKLAQPELLILSWLVGYYTKTPEELIVEIEKTLGEVKKASPRTKVLLVGAFPYWHDSLFRQYILFWRKNKEVLPHFTSYGLQEKDAGLNASLELAFNHRENVRFISPYQFFCSKNGCMTRLSSEDFEMPVVDYGHLSPNGSEALVRYFQREFLDF